MSDNYLAHYGIKRRSGRYKWGTGVRPYQGETFRERRQIKNAVSGKSRSRKRFDESHTIPKGTTMYRVTGKAKEGLSGSKYVTYLEPDRSLYRGGESRGRRYAEKNKNIYEHKMELQEDLKIPSKKDTGQTIKDVVNKNPQLFDIAALKYIEMCTSDETMDILLSKGAEYQKEYVLNHWKRLRDVNIDPKTGVSDKALPMLRYSMNGVEPLRQEIMNELSKKGYNAMVDEGGVGVYSPEGIEPLVVFDSGKSLKKTGTEKVSESEQIKATDKYIDWRRNARRSDLARKWTVR